MINPFIDGVPEYARIGLIRSRELGEKMAFFSNIDWDGIDDPGWERELDYETDTLVTEVRLVHHGIGIALTCRDCVDFDINLYLRKLELEQIRNIGNRPLRAFWIITPPKRLLGRK